MKTSLEFDTLQEAQAWAEAVAPSWQPSHYALPALMNVLPIFPVARGEKLGKVEITFAETCFGGMHYEGSVLTQAHKRVLAELVSLRNGKLLHGYISVKPFQAVKTLGWGVNARSKELLREILKDLMEPKFTVWKKGGSKARGHYFRLVADFNSEDESGWLVQLSCTAMVMLTQLQPTWLSRKERTELRDGMQTFLYDYFRSQPPAHSASFADLLVASGSTATNKKEFARAVREAAEVIERKCGWGLDKKLRGKLKMVKTTLK